MSNSDEEISFPEGSGQFIVVTILEDDRGEVQVLPVNDEARQVAHLIIAAEYLLYLAATGSQLPFEDAVDALVKGSMTYRHNRKPGK